MHKKTGLTIVVLLIFALVASIALITGFALINKTDSSSKHENPASVSPNAVPLKSYDSSGSQNTPSSSSNIAPHKAIDELSKSKSTEEISKIKELNNTALNPNADIDSRKKAVDQLVQLEFVETRDRVSLLLDDLTELKKLSSLDKKNDEIIGYITVSLSELYKETNKPAGAKKENQPVTAVNSGSEQPALPEDSSSASEIIAEVSAETSAEAPAQESTVTEAATQKSLIELANLKMDSVNSVDKLTAVLFDANQSQAVKLLGLKKLVELDSEVSLPVFEKLLSDSAASDDVVKVTAIKTVYDMNTTEALSLLEKTAQSSNNVHVKETIRQLTGK